MSLIQQNLEKLEHFALAPTASRTTNLDGASVDLREYDGDVVLVLDVASGGTSTCTVTLQDSADNVTFAAVSAPFTRNGVEQASGTVQFSQVSTTASKQTIVVSKDGMRRYVKAVSVEGGTHVYSVNGVGVKKYG
jgi:hypothetical protein